MKSLSNLNFGETEVLERNQMKSIVGGHPSCEGGASTTPISMDWEDGSRSTYNVCPEHVGAMVEMLRGMM